MDLGSVPCRSFTYDSLTVNELDISHSFFWMSQTDQNRFREAVRSTTAMKYSRIPLIRITVNSRIRLIRVSERELPG